MATELYISGAREHNLKNVSLTIPRRKLVVFTGLSGSGKSSLAFDTIYAEGQRRYLESLSAYARQFLDQLQKPQVDVIDGLSPAISIEQKFISRNPRSTVGTVTEIYDFLRLLYSRIGIPNHCGMPVESQTTLQILEQIKSRKNGEKFAILAPIARSKKGEFQKELLDLNRKGFVRALIDGEECNLSEPIKLKKNLKHDVSIYVDRLILKDGIDMRLADAIEISTELSGGLVEVHFYQSNEQVLFSTDNACVVCGFSFPELEPRSFSFNSPHGACPHCNGLGSLDSIDPIKVVPDHSLSLSEDAIAPWKSKSRAWKTRIFDALDSKYGIDRNVPFSQLSKANQKIILHGSGKDKLTFKAKGKTFTQKFEGVVTLLENALVDEKIDREEISEFFSQHLCPSCHGSRLKPEMKDVLVGKLSISELTAMPVDHILGALDDLKLSEMHGKIATPIMKEILARLQFLKNVGLGYLALNRSAATISGGEAQRIRLATQIGSNLVGVLYILDEPSIGLHQRDNERLILTLEKLRDQGNSVIVVEHDQETIERADFLVDLGPGAGQQGGTIVFAGAPKDIHKNKNSLTGDYLSGRKVIPIPQRRLLETDHSYLELHGAKLHNLKNVSLKLPLGRFIVVTGVSGSGKSSLVIDTLLPILYAHQNKQDYPQGLVDKVAGFPLINKIIHVDQSPIGRTPRSNPATYTGLFTDIRALFAGLPDSKIRGYGQGRFSFNVAGGRCDACSGAGTIRVSMHFLPDVFVQCEVCRGRRYNRETLEVRYRGKSIADVLEMTIEDAFSFFERVPSIRAKLQTLLDVGMGYVNLGQNAVTLSGGEAQRIKLSKELTKRATGKTLYVLDEPTTGLHFDDVRKLLEILQSLVDQGNTVVVIEHNLDVIKQADHLIDLGPEGGEAGGNIIYEGVPEKIGSVTDSETGRFLLPLLTEKKAKKKTDRKKRSASNLPSSA